MLFILSAEARSFFDRLYDEFRVPMWRYALALTHDEERAREAVQTAFTNMMRHPDKLLALESGEVRAYATVSVRNAAYSIHRRKSGGECELTDFRDAPEESDVAELIVTKVLIAGAVGSLPVVDRGIVYLRYCLDLTFSDIAKQLDMKQTTVIERHRRILRNLEQIDLT